MADLLTHVFVAYALFTVVSWRLAWLTRRWIAVATVGAILPDLNRATLIVPELVLESVLGVPFSLDALHTLGGVVLLAAIGAASFTSHHRRAFGCFLAGALTHLLADGLKAYADGAAGTWLYPFTWYRHPTPSWYVSSDPVILVFGLTIAIVVWLADRARDTTS